MFFSNKLIKIKTKESELAFGITAIEGIAIHSFIDGVIYSVTFSVATLTGILAGTGLVAHEFAEGIITFSFLIKGKVAPRKAAAIAFVAASLTTPFGAFVAWPLINRLSSSMLGLALGAVSGVLIYISASHLLPEARVNEKHHSFASFFAGVLFSLLLLLTK